ncbi:MAG: MBL fold metallo-hydrolase [Pseudomonadota bacterium]
MKLTVLGSGSPEAYARRASSGYLVETGVDRVLFDCGGGVVDNLLRAGLRPTDITHLVFSHLHSDHMMDYARLVHAAWDAGGAPLKVFGPAPICEITTRLFGADGVFSHDLRARTELAQSQEVWLDRGGNLPRAWPSPAVQEIAPGEKISGEGWEIASCAVPHAQPLLECMGFALKADGRTFVYSGDAGLCEDLEVLAQGADFLLHWCYRQEGEEVTQAMAALAPTPSEIGHMARRAGVSALMLTHFREHMDRPEDYARSISSASEAFGKPVRVAEDLAVVSI